MKKLFRIHFAAIAVSDLLLFTFFLHQIRDIFGLAPTLWLHFNPCSGITAISLGLPTQTSFP